MRNLKYSVFVVACLSITATEAHAQRYGVPRAPGARYSSPFKRPTLSPYLDLLNRPRGRSFSFQYFRRVRPELEFQAADARLSRSVEGLQRQLNVQKDSGQNPALGVTGHRTSFMNFRGYYNFGRR